MALEQNLRPNLRPITKGLDPVAGSAMIPAFAGVAQKVERQLPNRDAGPHESQKPQGSRALSHRLGTAENRQSPSRPPINPPAECRDCGCWVEARDICASCSAWRAERGQS